MTDDKTSWENFTQDVKPTISAKKHVSPPPELPRHSVTISPSNDPMSDLLECNSLLTEKHYSPLTNGHVANIDGRTAQRFLRGKMPIDATLDLHGYYQEQALEKLQIFIAHAYHRHHRNLLIITGKGKRTTEDALSTRHGVLREQVPQWLNMPMIRPLVLAFTHAQPHDGGTGALYVLLKRNRDE